MTVIWRGDDLGAWHGKEVLDSSRISTVDVKRNGGSVKAFRFQVKQTDIVHNGVRAELVREDHRPEGTERYTAFSVLFPKDFFPTVAGKWQVFHQYHQSYKDGTTIGRSPPVEFSLNGNKMQLSTNDWHSPAFTQRVLWSAPLEFDKWYDFVLHARWSSNPLLGFLHLFLNGAEVLPKTPTFTMFPGYEVYMKSGIYRSRDIMEDATLYQRGFIEATTLEEAMAARGTMPPVAPALARWSVGSQASHYAVQQDGRTVAFAETYEIAQKIIDALNKTT